MCVYMCVCIYTSNQSVTEYAQAQITKLVHAQKGGCHLGMCCGENQLQMRSGGTAASKVVAGISNVWY